MIIVNERFDVASPPREVWAVLSDPHQVISCIPRASLGENRGDGSFDASLLVKFGPTRVTFRATVGLALNAATMEGQLSAHGTDANGGARIRAAAVFHVSGQPQGEGSTVLIEGNVEIGGRMAPLIEAGATVVVQRMSAEFARALAARCAEARISDGRGDVLR